MPTATITLRPTTVADLHTLFHFQTDPEAIYLAAFTPKDPTDKAAYLSKYSKFLDDPTINNQTILVGDTIAGSIAKFIIEGDTELTYWIEKAFWGQGIATAALTSFLQLVDTRPIFARVAFDNFASQRVLEKCGFVKMGTDKGFANGRGVEVEEVVCRLD